MRWLPEIITTSRVRLSSPTTGNQFNSLQLNSHSFAPFEAPFMPSYAPLSLNTTVPYRRNLDQQMGAFMDV